MFGFFGGENVNANEKELIEMIRSSKDKQMAFLIALEVITDYLKLHGPSAVPSAVAPSESD